MQTRDLVPAEPFARVAQEWLGEQEESSNPIALLAQEMKTDRELVRKIVTGKRETISFSTADKIVTVCTDGLGWLNDPELYAIYHDFDFGWLDKTRPCAA